MKSTRLIQEKYLPSSIPGFLRDRSNCLGLTQLGEDGGVWAGVARPNTPNFSMICVTPIVIIEKEIGAICVKARP
jgi:hypothetical protein